MIKLKITSEHRDVEKTYTPSASIRTLTGTEAYIAKILKPQWSEFKNRSNESIHIVSQDWKPLIVLIDHFGSVFLLVSHRKL